MIDSIQSSRPELKNEFENITIKASHPTKSDLKNAEEEVASLYYLTTLSSLASHQENSEKKTTQIKANQETAEKSFFQKVSDSFWGVKDWLWGVFGWEQTQSIQKSESTSAAATLENDPDSLSSAEENANTGGIPQLQQPDVQARRRLSQAVADVNRELAHQLKDLAEFEREMERSSSNQLDKLIFIHLVNSSIHQKKLKETSTLLAFEEVQEKHKKNQELRTKYFDLVDAITEGNKKLGVLSWINMGLTVVTIGGTALACFVSGGGALFAVGLPLSYFVKGTTTMTEGIVRLKNDQRTGDLVVVKQETKANQNHQKDNLSKMQVNDQEIAKLLKIIRIHLKNQTETERSFFGR